MDSTLEGLDDIGTFACMFDVFFQNKSKTMIILYTEDAKPVLNVHTVYMIM